MARSGPSSFQRMDRDPARPIYVLKDGPRPDAAHRMLKFSRPAISFSNVSARPGPALHRFKILGLAQPGPSLFRACYGVTLIGRPGVGSIDCLYNGPRPGPAHHLFGGWTAGRPGPSQVQTFSKGKKLETKNRNT